MMLNIARAGKFLLGIATAGIGVVATITGGFTAIDAMGKEDGGDTDSDDE